MAVNVSRFAFLTVMARPAALMAAAAAAVAVRMVGFVMVPIATLKMFRTAMVKYVDPTEWVALAVPVERTRSVKLGSANRTVYPIVLESNAAAMVAAVVAVDVRERWSARAGSVRRSDAQADPLQMLAGPSWISGARQSSRLGLTGRCVRSTMKNLSVYRTRVRQVVTTGATKPARTAVGRVNAS